MKALPVLASVLFLAALPADAVSAPDEFVAPNARNARVYAEAARRGPATLAAASPTESVSGFLSSAGRDARTTASLVETATSSSKRSGLSHLRLGQEVEGLQVYGAYAKAAFGANGRLVHVIDALAPVPPGPLASPDVSEQAALEAVLSRHYPCLGTLPEAAARNGNTVEFAAGAFFHRNPTVTRVAIPLRSGRMETGFLVETWSEKRNYLHHTLVGSDGRIRHVELRTNKDSYNVFVEDPLKGAQQVVAGPGAGNAESPGGWLGAGGQSAWSISGNNAHAYLDADNDNAPDAGGASIFDGQFLTAADLSQEPATTGNRNVAVQNLFYLNNVVHDLLYRAGFDEAAGNFQGDNFGSGGVGGDPVSAEAQDGGGTDNANFSTPADGSPPRMQMYLWSALGTHELLVNGPGSLAGTYPASAAVFGPQLDAAGVTGDVVLAVDRRGATSDGCERFTNAAEVAGNIALVDRGTCAFVDKVLNAQSAGAVGVIVVNDADGTVLMGGSNRRVSIPAIMVGQGDGAAIEAELGAGVNATPRAVSPAPPRIDGDLDADIVFHEYGHGLTWRMIGSMSGPMSSAVGEGMSDVLAVLANGDDRVGEYAYSNPIGIRTEPYDAYSRTYGDVAGEETHFDGEVYGAIGWRLGRLYAAAGLGLDDTLGDLVGGMNFTPAGPAFEDMRDGILAQVVATAPDRECLVWQAFAEYGVGAGAASVVRGPNIVTTESFALPAACAAP